MQKLLNCLSVAILITLISCQASGQNSQSRLPSSKSDDEIEKLIQNTPDIYKISWNVCGSDSLNLHEGVNNNCNVTKDTQTPGFELPVFVWGPVGKPQFSIKPSFGGVSTVAALSIKSRGCFPASPQSENFYQIKEFLLKKGSKPDPTKDVKVELISRQEKQQKIRQQIAVANVERNVGMSYEGLPNSTSCRLVTQN